MAYVVLASGFGRRFALSSGVNKLLTEFRGKELFKYTIDKGRIHDFEHRIAVTQYTTIEEYCKKQDYAVIINKNPEEGIASSIRLAVEYVREVTDCEGIVFCVADQPLFKDESLKRMVDAFEVCAPAQKRIICPKCNERTGNPVIFPRAFFDELLCLEGDRGGKRVINAHPDSVYYIDVKEEELMDIDSVEELFQMEEA